MARDFPSYFVWHMLNGEVEYAVGIDEGKVDCILSQVYK